MSSLLTVIDATTSAPVPGAAAFFVYSDGSAANLIANSAGQIMQTKSLGGTATVSKSGYTSQQISTLFGTVALVSQTAGGVQLNITVEPSTDQSAPTAEAPSAGAVVTITGGVTETLTIGIAGGAQTAKKYPTGSYQFTVQQDGYQTLNQTVAISAGQTDVTLTLMQASTGLSTVPATASPSAGVTAVSATSLASSSDDSYEYVYPNSVDGKYFQAAQARMYIGKLFVDELASCQWMVAENKIPIFGYRSKKFDAVGIGRSLVQGQLAINFISEGYMYVLLQEYSKKISSKTNTTGLTDAIKSQIDSLVKQRAQAVVNGGSTTSLDTQISRLAATSKAAATYIASSLKTTSASALAATTTSHQNAVYLDIPFDIQVQFEGAGRIVQKTLKSCFLGANDQAFAHDGRTLLETYSFIAREVN